MRLVRSLAVLIGGLVVGRAVASAVRVKTPSETPQRSLFAKSLIGAYSVINRYVEWHELPTPLGLFNLLAYRIVLRDKNLYDTSPKPVNSTSPGANGHTESDLHHLY